MICPKCDGSGIADMVQISEEETDFIPCEYCEGTGEYTLTNEEWFCSLSTEEKAEVLGNIANNAYFCAINGKTSTCYNRKHCTGYCNYGWEKWLKEKHET